MKKALKIIGWTSVAFWALFLIGVIQKIDFSVKAKETYGIVLIIVEVIATVTTIAFFVLEKVDSVKEKKKRKELLNRIRGKELKKVHIEPNDEYLRTIMDGSDCLIRCDNRLVEIVLVLSEGKTNIEKNFYMSEDEFKNSTEFKMIMEINKD